MEAKRRSKYNAKKTRYNGKLYDSKLEARRAWQLDQLLKAGEIKEWKGQIPFKLYSLRGGYIGDYVIDFRVIGRDGRAWYEEVKGKETEMWRWKFKHFRQDYPGLDVRVLKQKDIG